MRTGIKYGFVFLVTLGFTWTIHSFAGWHEPLAAIVVGSSIATLIVGFMRGWQ